MLNQKANPISKAGIALVLVLIVVYHLSVSAYAELRPGPREGFYEDDGIVYLYEGGVRSAKSGEYKAEGGTFTLDEGKVTAALLNVPKVNQLPKYPTGCEGASAAAVLQFYGLDVTLDEMIDAIPRENIEFRDGKRYGPSIEEKFVGDPAWRLHLQQPGLRRVLPGRGKGHEQRARETREQQGRTQHYGRHHGGPVPQPAQRKPDGHLGHLQHDDSGVQELLVHQRDRRVLLLPERHPRHGPPGLR